MSKNLDRWRFYCRDFESPDLFIDWTFYAMISAALQRRVWIGREGFKELYPNQYMIFIGPPAIGKTVAAGEATKLFKSFDIFEPGGKPKTLFKIAPSSITLEALTRFLHNNYTINQWPPELNKPKGSVYTSSPLVFFADKELGSLFKENQNDFVTFLTEGWESGDFHRLTKTQGEDVVKNMCITMLASATPEWMKNVVTSRMIGEGFTSRVIFVYGDTKRKQQFLYTFNDEQVAEFKEIRKHVEQLTKVFGQIPFEGEVFDWCESWYKDSKPINSDKRLVPYYGRKKLHLLKLAMAVHFADNTDLCLTVSDLEKAQKLLAETEKDMHKALCGSGNNPVFGLATDIYNAVEKEQVLTHKQILLRFFDQGTAEDIILAETYLTETQQLENTTVMGQPAFKIREKQ